MSAPHVLASTNGATRSLTAVAAFVAGFVFPVAILMIRHWLIQHRRRKQGREELIVDNLINECLDWLAKVKGAPNTSTADNPYTPYRDNESVVAAAERLQPYFGASLTKRIEEVIRVVNGLGEDPARAPNLDQERDDVIKKKLPLAVKELEWWADQFRSDPLLSGRPLARRRRKALRLFGYL